MTSEPLDDDYRMPLNPKPLYCSQCDNEVGEDETLCLECLERREDAGAVWQDKELYGRTAVDWFTETHPEPPKREDGPVDFECMCGEILVEGGDYQTVKERYDSLPDNLKRPLTQP